MNSSSKKPRMSRWFWLVALVVMFCTSTGCAAFDPEPEKPLTVEEVMRNPRPGLTKYSKNKFDQ